MSLVKKRREFLVSEVPGIGRTAFYIGGTNIEVEKPFGALTADNWPDTPWARAFGRAVIGLNTTGEGR